MRAACNAAPLLRLAQRACRVAANVVERLRRGPNFLDGGVKLRILHALQCRRADLPFAQCEAFGRQRSHRFRRRDRAFEQRLRLDDVMDEAACNGLERRISRAAEDRVHEKLRRDRAAHDLHGHRREWNTDEELGHADAAAIARHQPLIRGARKHAAAGDGVPLIAATTGAGWGKKAVDMVLSAGRKLPVYGAPPSSRRTRSTPAENVRPVAGITTARAGGISAKRAVNASQNSMLMALTLPCARRSTATPPCSVTSITLRAPRAARRCRPWPRRRARNAARDARRARRQWRAPPW